MSITRTGRIDRTKAIGKEKENLGEKELGRERTKTRKGARENGHNTSEPLNKEKELGNEGHRGEHIFCRNILLNKKRQKDIKKYNKGQRKRNTEETSASSPDCSKEQNSNIAKEEENNLLDSHPLETYSPFFCTGQPTIRI